MARVQIQLVSLLCASTYLHYDHLLTLDQEIKYFWKPKAERTSKGRINWKSLLFFLNQYFTAIGNVFILYSFIGTPPESSCQAIQTIRILITVSAQILIEIILTLRIYAIYGCSKRLLWTMVTVMIVLIGLAAFSAFYREAKFSGGEVFCHSIEAVQRTGGWEAMFAYDTLIFLLALWKAFKTRRAPRIPLLAVLIRDGAAYFGAMSLANLANILTLYFTDSETRGFMEYMTSYISVTLTSRMMLRLHQAADTTHAESMAMTMDTIRFNAVRTGFSEDSTEATSVTGNES